MGDPKRQRKAYDSPIHPWQKERIESERGLLQEYGLKNHREIWRIKSFVKKAADQAKKLIGERTERGDIERKRLISRLHKYGLIPADAQVTDVLNIQPKDVIERRLQTMVVRKGLSKTMRQSRQLIVHGHISVNGRKQTSPSYLVKVSEENSIDFSGVSPFQDEDHPERAKMMQGGKRPTSVKTEEKTEKKPSEKKEKSDKKEKNSSNKETKSEKKQEAKENKPEKENKESSEKSDETDKKSKSNEKEGNSDEKSKEEKGDEE
jgi:small subunit ribosomal protein S4